MLQIELTGFPAVEHNQPFRGELQQLAADFRADAARAAGDQEHSIIDPLADVFQLQFYGFASQQVLDGHWAGLHGQSSADEFLETGQDFHLHLPLAGFIDQSPYLAAG